ncbi:MAG: hypothetical protein WCH83_00580 [Alphaproteobacteria bacterium]
MTAIISRLISSFLVNVTLLMLGGCADVSRATFELSTLTGALTETASTINRGMRGLGPATQSAGGDTPASATAANSATPTAR